MSNIVNLRFNKAARELQELRQKEIAVAGNSGDALSEYHNSNNGLSNNTTVAETCQEQGEKNIKNFLTVAKPSTAKPLDPLIADFIMRGTVNSIQGLPDSGKSWLTLSIALAVASGGVFPDRFGDMVRVPKGRVLYANFDDDEDDVHRRLKSMGATDEQAENIFILSSDSGLTFNSPRLAEVFDEVKPTLAIFDTLQHFIGAKTDLHRANETNAALLPLKNLTKKYNCATIVIQHINKQAGSGNGGSSVIWGLGSTAINGLFRSVWTVGALTREGDGQYRKAIFASKTNQLPVKPPARLFDLDPDKGFLWAGVDETVTSGDLIKGDSVRREAHRPADRRSDAENFLLEVLDDGAMPSAEVSRLAAEQGIRRNTLDRARKSLSIESDKIGKIYYMWLPENSAPPKVADLWTFGGADEKSAKNAELPTKNNSPKTQILLGELNSFGGTENEYCMQTEQREYESMSEMAYDAEFDE